MVLASSLTEGCLFYLCRQRWVHDFQGLTGVDCYGVLFWTIRLAPPRHRRGPLRKYRSTTFGVWVVGAKYTWIPVTRGLVSFFLGVSIDRNRERWRSSSVGHRRIVRLGQIERVKGGGCRVLSVLPMEGKRLHPLVSWPTVEGWRNAGRAIELATTEGRDAKTRQIKEKLSIHNNSVSILQLNLPCLSITRLTISPVVAKEEEGRRMRRKGELEYLNCWHCYPAGDVSEIQRLTNSYL